MISIPYRKKWPKIDCSLFKMSQTTDVFGCLVAIDRSYQAEILGNVRVMFNT